MNFSIGVRVIPLIERRKYAIILEEGADRKELEDFYQYLVKKGYLPEGLQIEEIARDETNKEIVNENKNDYCLSSLKEDKHHKTRCRIPGFAEIIAIFAIIKMAVVMKY